MKIKPLNDMVFIEPIENLTSGGIVLLKDTESHRRGIIKFIKEDSEYKVGDTVIYPDTFKTMEVDGELTYHLVEEKSIYFVEVDNE